MKILFLHGLEGGVNGSKITFLRANGFEVVAPSIPKHDYTKAVAIAEASVDDVDLKPETHAGPWTDRELRAANIPEPLWAVASMWGSLEEMKEDIHS